MHDISSCLIGKCSPEILQDVKYILHAISSCLMGKCSTEILQDVKYILCKIYFARHKFVSHGQMLARDITGLRIMHVYFFFLHHMLHMNPTIWTTSRTCTEQVTRLMIICIYVSVYVRRIIYMNPNHICEPYHLDNFMYV